jgi:hypothetical protein
MSSNSRDRRLCVLCGQLEEEPARMVRVSKRKYAHRSEVSPRLAETILEDGQLDRVPRAILKTNLLRARIRTMMQIRKGARRAQQFLATRN